MKSITLKMVEQEPKIQHEHVCPKCGFLSYRNKEMKHDSCRRCKVKLKYVGTIEIRIRKVEGWKS